MTGQDSNEMSLLTSYLDTFRLVLSRYPRFFIHFLLISTLFLSVAAVASYTPFLLRQAANEVGKAQTFGFYFYALAYAACWTLAGVLQNVKGIFSAGVLARSDAALHKMLMRHVFACSHSEQKAVDPGVVAQDISRAAVSFSAVTTAAFWTIVPIFFEFIVSMAIIQHAVGWRFAWLFGACVALLAFVSWCIASRSGNFHSAIFRAQNKAQGFMVERLGALHEIRANNALVREEQRLDGHLDETAAVIWRANLRMGAYLGAQALAIGAVLGVFTAYSVRLNNASNFTNGDFVMIAGYVGALTMQLRLLSGALIELKRHQIALGLGLKYLGKKGAWRGRAPDFGSVSGRVGETIFSLHQVGVCVAGRDLFSNLTHRFMRGRFSVISAPSGFGKTTLIHSLLGFVPVCEGRIEFCGVEVGAGSTHAILESVALAPQSAHIFNDSLRFNLSYGCPQPVADGKLLELLRALDYAGSATDAREPVDLGEALGAGGRALSGGERQRLSIARAVLRNKSVLILDEPTAFLDKALAQKIIAYLAARVPTLIVVTHDEDIVAVADDVLRLGPYAPTPQGLFK